MFNKEEREATHLTKLGLKERWRWLVHFFLSSLSGLRIRAAGCLSLCDGSLLGHLLLNVLQELVVRRSRIGPILHQVLKESGFS